MTAALPFRVPGSRFRVRVPVRVPGSGFEVHRSGGTRPAPAPALAPRTGTKHQEPRTTNLNVKTNLEPGTRNVERFRVPGSLFRVRVPVRVPGSGFEVHSSGGTRSAPAPALAPGTGTKHQ